MEPVAATVLAAEDPKDGDIGWVWKLLFKRSRIVYFDQLLQPSFLNLILITQSRS